MADNKSEMLVDKMGALDKLMIKFNAPKMENKTNFFRLLAVTQKAGLGVRDSMAAILKSEQHPGMKKVLDDLIVQAGQGLSLADSLSNHRYLFLSEEIELIRSSETMGNLAEVLQNIAADLEGFQKLKGKVKGALTMPTMVLGMTAIAVVVLMIKVLPAIVSLFPNQESLPGITIFMLDASDFLQAYWYYLIAGIISVVVGYKFSYKNILPFKILVDKLFLKAPVLGPLIMKYNLYRFSKLLGDFFSAGVSPTIALQQMSDIFKNYHYKAKTLNVKKDLEIGLGFVEAIEGSWLFDPILVQIIGIGESTGNIGEVLVKISSFYKDGIDSSLEGLMKLIEPLLMAFVAVVVGIIVAAIFLPMADLLSTIG